MVIFKGVMYCGAALLTPLAALLSEGAKTNTWPASVAIAAAIVTGIVQTFWTARAYTDGGVERLKTEGQP
jgi:membrane protein DedA with SNARE-associated domain